MRREKGKVLRANLMIHSYEFLRIILTLKNIFWGTDNKIEFPSICWSVFVASRMVKVMFVLIFHRTSANTDPTRFCKAFPLRPFQIALFREAAMMTAFNSRV